MLGHAGLAWGRAEHIHSSPAPPAGCWSQEEQQRLQEEQEKKAREAAAASKSLNTTVDVQVRLGPGQRGARVLILLFPELGAWSDLRTLRKGGRRGPVVLTVLDTRVLS